MTFTELNDKLFLSQNREDFRHLYCKPVEIAKFRNGRIMRLSSSQSHIYNLRTFTKISNEYIQKIEIDTVYKFTNDVAVKSFNSPRINDMKNAEFYYPVVSEVYLKTSAMILNICQLALNTNLPESTLDNFYLEISRLVSKYINEDINVDVESDKCNNIVTFNHLVHVCEHKYPFEYIADLVYNFMHSNINMYDTQYYSTYNLDTPETHTNVTIYAYVLDDDTVGNLWFIYPFNQLSNPFGIYVFDRNNNDYATFENIFEISDIIRNLAELDYVCDYSEYLNSELLITTILENVSFDKSSWREDDDGNKIHPVYDIQNKTNINIYDFNTLNQFKLFPVTIGYHLNYDYALDLMGYDFTNLISYVWLMYILPEPCAKYDDSIVNSTDYKFINGDERLFVKSIFPSGLGVEKSRQQIIANYEHDEVIVNGIKIFPFLGRMKDEVFTREEIKKVDLSSFINVG